MTSRPNDPTGLSVLLALPTQPAPEFAEWRPSSAATRGSPPPPLVDHRPTSAATRADKSVPSQHVLTGVEIQYLRAVIGNPGLSSSEYPAIAKIGPRRAQKVRDRLVQLGYLRLHTVNKSGRGRSAIVLEPLDAAIKAVAGAKLGSGPHGGGR